MTENTIFDYFNDITHFKTANLDLSNYNSFLINRSLCHYFDTYLTAIEANQIAASGSKKAQYQFLVSAVRQGRKRFVYPKKKKADERLSDIAEYYGISKKVAKKYLNLMTDDIYRDIEHELKNRKGGKYGRAGGAA